MLEIPPAPGLRAIAAGGLGLVSLEVAQAILVRRCCYAAIMDEMIRARPSAAKGRYLHSVVFASTMGPGVKVDPSITRDIAGEPVAA